MLDRGKIQLFATRSSAEYAKKVTEELKSLNEYTEKYDDLVGRLEVKEFSDGEIEVDIDESVRKKDVYVFHNSASRNRYGLSVGDNQIELYHAIDALKRAQARSLTVFEPYTSCSRSDRATRRTSVGTWIHFKTMISLGMDHYITFQLHSDKSKTILDPTKAYIDDMPAISLLKRAILKDFVKTKHEFDNVVHEKWAFCSVDAGGEKMARKFSETFNADLIIANKRRNHSKVNTVEKIDILSDSPLNDKIVWIVDDMIDTGGSVYTLIKELKNRGVKKVNIAIVHPLFSGPAMDRLQELSEEGYLDNIICADTIYIPDEYFKRLPNLKAVSSSHLAAEIIYRINIGSSITKFFSPIAPYRYLS